MDQILNIQDLRTILAEEIMKIRREETTPGNVNAIVNATGKILSSVKMEMEYAKMLGKTPRIDFIKVKELSKADRGEVRALK